MAYGTFAFILLNVTHRSHIAFFLLEIFVAGLFCKFHSGSKFFHKGNQGM